MYQSKLLFSLTALGLFGCDAPFEKQSEFLSHSKEFSVPKAQTGSIQCTDGCSANLTDDEGENQEFLPDEYREFCIDLDGEESSFYDIVVFSNGNEFDILQDGKPVLSSKNMSQKTVDQIAPLMQQVFAKICILEEASDVLAKLSPRPKTTLAQLTNPESNRNIITKTRLKYRIENNEREIVDLIQQSIEISKRAGEQISSEMVPNQANPTNSMREEALMSLDTRFSLIALKDRDGNLYEIAVSQNAQVFEIWKNSELALKSDALSTKLFEKIKPVMKGIVENINNIAKDEEVLEEMTPKSPLGIVLKTRDNKNIFTKIRLENRVDSAKNSILQNVVELIDMVEKGQSQPEEEKEPKPVKTDTPSSEIYLSLNRLKQIENLRFHREYSPPERWRCCLQNIVRICLDEHILRAFCDGGCANIAYPQ